jgi:hypothetical protein
MRARQYRIAILLVLLLGASLLARSLRAAALLVDDKKKQSFYLKPDQTVDLADPKTITAKQNCENWALAAGLEAMLKQQAAAIPQSYWIMRLYGGELCEPEVPSADALGREVNREFVLDDGRHVKLALHYASGAPSNTDALIYALKEQQLSLLVLHGHPFYLLGATYDERIGRDGQRMFVIKELRLANTYAKEPGLTFENGRDNLEDIQGIFSVSVTPITSQQW